METEEKLEQEMFYKSPVRRRMTMFMEVFAHIVYHYQGLCHGKDDVLTVAVQMKVWAT